jgi:hypothetical protein
MVQDPGTALVAEGVRGVARLAADSAVRAGARVELAVDPGQVRVFSAAEGRALWHPGLAEARAA